MAIRTDDDSNDYTYSLGYGAWIEGETVPFWSIKHVTDLYIEGVDGLVIGPAYSVGGIGDCLCVLFANEDVFSPDPCVLMTLEVSNQTGSLSGLWLPGLDESTWVGEDEETIYPHTPTNFIYIPQDEYDLSIDTYQIDYVLSHFDYNNGGTFTITK